MKNTLLILTLITVSACFTDTSGPAHNNPTSNNKTSNNKNTVGSNNNNSNNSNNSNNANNTTKSTAATTVACVPSTEICDQIDNNCDGNIDEGLLDCCFSANDCSDGKTCSANNKCVACDDTNLCIGPEASKCDASTCVACADSNDCSHLAETPFCTNGVCGACSETADCSNGEVCDLDQLVCTKCLTDTECGGDKCLVDAVDATKNDCVTCLTNDACPTSAASKCSDTNTCESCVVDADCSHVAGLSFCRNDKCNECEVNTDCSNGEKCHPTDLVCTPCLVDADCGNDKCLIDQADAANNICVSCLDNLSCTEVGTSKCGAANTCEACGIDADCAHLSDTTKCKGGTCVGCVDDSNCGGKACNLSTGICSTQTVGSAGHCESCVSGSACSVGACISTVYQGNPAGKFCLPQYIPGISDCSMPYQDISGGLFRYCGVDPALTTCPAVRSIGHACNLVQSCGVGINNAFAAACVGGSLQISGYCTYPCDNDNQCPTNSTCTNSKCTNPP